MNPTMLLPTNTNFLVMLGATAAAWLFGALWYGMFGKTWVEAQGTTVEAFKAKQAASTGTLAAKVPFILSFVAQLVMVYVLYGVMKHVAHTGPLTIRIGLITGALIWFGFVLTAIAVNNSFSGRKTMLTAIDAGHWLGVMLILGTIVGAFAT
jgi:hypothetical protein